MLLVDDYANEFLHATQDKQVNATIQTNRISKRNLIYNLLNQGLQGHTSVEGKDRVSHPGVHFLLEDLGYERHNIRKAARNKLRERIHDVLLLDYLLGQSEESRTEREYGYDFLLDLENTETVTQLKKGPLGRFWVLPISSFPFAFSDKLRQLGIEGQSDHWLIAGGGDPITTPELFRYNFFKCVKQQVNEFFITPGAILDLMNRFSNIHIGTVWQKLALSALERLELRKSVLELDEHQESLFASSMLSFMRNNSDYKNSIDALKKFVQEVDAAPYPDIEKRVDEVLQIKGLNSPDLKKLLTDKARLFHVAITEFENEIAASPQGIVRFSGKSLPLIPNNFTDKLSGIRELWLSRNNLRKVPDALFKLKHLKKLDLSSNPLKVLPLLDNTDEVQLEVLDLTNTSLAEDIRKKHEGILEIRRLLGNSREWNTKSKRKLVVSYAHEDASILDELEKILTQLELEGLIEPWTDKKILAGSDWSDTIRTKFEEADLALFLLTPDFFASSFIYHVEREIGLKRAAANDCILAPIVAKPCNWENTPLGSFQALSNQGKPVSTSPNQDEAWVEIAKGLREILTNPEKGGQ